MENGKAWGSGIDLCPRITRVCAHLPRLVCGTSDPEGSDTETKFVLFTALFNLSYSFCMFIAGVFGLFMEMKKKYLLKGWLQTAKIILLL